MCTLLKTMLLLFLLETGVQKRCCFGSFVFLSQPDFVTAWEGKSASFQCLLQVDDLLLSFQVYWENANLEGIHPDKSVNITGIYNNNTNTVSSRLIFDNVSRERDDYYKCTIILRYQGRSHDVASSKLGKLEVQYFLKNDELQCEGPDNSVFREGDMISFKCQGLKCQPPIILKWANNSTDVLDKDRPITFFQNETLLIGHLVASSAIHCTKFTCVAKNHAALGHSATCSVGPFRVFHSPTVHITPNRATLFVPIIAEITLFCVASGFPNVHRYTWSCNPSYMIPNCYSHLPNVTIFLGNIRNSTEFNISCTATNHVGSSANYSIITIKYASGDVIPNCKIKGRNHSYGMIHSQIFLDIDMERLTCVTKVRDLSNVIFRWYTNGIFTVEHQGMHEVARLVNGSSVLIAQDSFLISEPGIATCDIIIHGTSVGRRACLFHTQISLKNTTEWDNFPRSFSGFNEVAVTYVILASSMTLFNEQAFTNKTPHKDLRDVSLIIIIFSVGFIIIIFSVSCVFVAQRSMYRDIRRGRNNVPVIAPLGHKNNQTNYHIPATPIKTEDPVYEIPENDQIVQVPGKVQNQSYGYEENIFKLTESDYEYEECSLPEIPAINKSVYYINVKAPRSLPCPYEPNYTYTNNEEFLDSVERPNISEEDTSDSLSGSVPSSPHGVGHIYFSAEALTNE